MRNCLLRGLHAHGLGSRLSVSHFKNKAPFMQSYSSEPYGKKSHPTSRLSPIWWSSRSLLAFRLSTHFFTRSFPSPFGSELTRSFSLVARPLPTISLNSRPASGLWARKPSVHALHSLQFGLNQPSFSFNIEIYSFFVMNKHFAFIHNVALIMLSWFL